MLVNRSNLNDLKSLNSHIHDKWFSVEKTIFDETNHEFRLFFGDDKGTYEEYLKITGVLNCNIIDTEKVVIYDLYGLSIDIEASKIYINGNIPIEIILDITKDFEISTIAV